MVATTTPSIRISSPVICIDLNIRPPPKNARRHSCDSTAGQGKRPAGEKMHGRLRLSGRGEAGDDPELRPLSQGSIIRLCAD